LLKSLKAQYYIVEIRFSAGNGCMFLALLILSIALAGIVVFQFAYMAFLHANNRHLREQLTKIISKPPKSVAAIPPPPLKTVEEIWPEFIENDQTGRNQGRPDGA
jgi:hypothetical protein